MRLYSVCIGSREAHAGSIVVDNLDEYHTQKSGEARGSWTAWVRVWLCHLL